MIIDFTLPKNEKQIMKLLWRENGGLICPEIIDLIGSKIWNL